MSKFTHVLNVRTRAIAPEYTSQWFDRVFSYGNVVDGVDYLKAGYPYSTGHRQITDSPYSLDGEYVGGFITTIAGVAMITIDGEYITTIT